ncbi:2995_t:CDS:2 [Gigaspora margarita]|uniref:2995_t:CDS:1 n=1 Tax=Gigaspora margarita TaxID=4874 RepID=A0ABN7WGN4_GIGMA|nr:2995_t:CDS:2 [Gigaspora margarita]
MDLKGNIEVLKEIRNLVSRYQEQYLESEQFGSTNTICTMISVEECIPNEVQTTTNMGKNSRLSIEDPVLEVKAKTNECKITTNIETNEETCTEMKIKELKREVPNYKKQHRN